MKKQFIYRGICAVFLLVCLGIVWLGAGDGSLPGKMAGGEALEKGHMPAEDGKTLERLLEGPFAPYVVSAKKVSWEPEELVDRIHILINNWQSASLSTRPIAGYIQVFTEPPGQGGLREYAVIYRGNVQHTFLVTDEGVYHIYSRPSLRIWQLCMQKLLQNVPEWEITEEEAKRYVHNIASEEKALYGYYIEDINRIAIWYDDIKFLFSEKYKLLECQSNMEEPEKGLRVRFWNPEEEQEREMQIRVVDMPAYDTYEGWREYLQTLHPELRSCYFFTYTAGEYCTDPFVMLEIEDMQYGYFQREGRWYQICFDIPGNGDYFDLELRKICSRMGYEYLIPSYWWCMDEKGNTIEADLMQDVYWLVEEISPGQIFSFECTKVKAREGGIWDEKVYQVAVTALGEEEPFQVFEVESRRGYYDEEFSSWDFDNAFYFVDFNADGFRDLEVLYFYGANGGSVITFVWSPSQGEFVRMPEELGNWDYRVYPETRRLDVYYRAGGAGGAHELYQWSGEMDYELIRYMEYRYEDVWDEDRNYVGELYYTRIVAYDRGREKVLTDYTYDSDDDSSYYVGRLYRLDVAWEKKVAVTGQDKSCILRYAQNKAVIDEDGQEEVYLDYLFLFREDTYLLYTLPEQEAPAAYSDFTWKKDTQQLVVSYEDGSQRCYQWDGEKFLNCEDYTDAR